jgi:hypothetical protein
VFEGGFTLEAAEAVLDVSACDPKVWTVDVLHSLIDKSFVRPVGQERFGLLRQRPGLCGGHHSFEGRYPGSGPAAVHAAQHRHGTWLPGWGRSDAVEGGAVPISRIW